ncbi:MAG TPA: neutral/alkaline non-lysosomal ceramidase N-terminal domain-containing protein [bacterium]|nr:neutral/alkaline non-lysosomal ceramidase N-terminal domain-containing protein [bacterium]
MRRRPALALTAALIVVLAVWAGAQENQPTTTAPGFAPGADFLIGFATVDLTPDPTASPGQLHGYGARENAPATGVLDPLHARAMVVRDRAGHLVGLVAVDLLMVTADVRDVAVSRLRPLGINDHNLLLTATHTHSGYSNYDRRSLLEHYFGDYDKQRFDATVAGIVRAVEQAYADLQPARLLVAQTKLPGLNRNRREPAYDMDNGRWTDDAPQPDAFPTDETMTVLRVTDPAGGPRGALVHYTAHPTILSPANLSYSAEWPGAMCAALQERHGATMLLNGALGDVASPRQHWGDPADEQKRMNDYGRAVAQRADALLDRAQAMRVSVVGGFSARRIPPPILLRFYYGARMFGPLRKAFLLSESVVLQTIRLGDLVLFAVPGEPTAAVGEQIKSLCPAGSTCLVVAPANDYIGYLVTADEYAAGSYHADSCFFAERTVPFLLDGFTLALRNLQQNF